MANGNKRKFTTQDVLDLLQPAAGDTLEFDRGKKDSLDFDFYTASPDSPPPQSAYNLGALTPAPTPQTQELAPGIEPVGGQPVQPAPKRPGLDYGQFEQMLGQVANQAQGLTEVRLPDGTTIKGVGPDAGERSPSTTRQLIQGGRDAESPLTGAQLNQMFPTPPEPSFQDYLYPNASDQPPQVEGEGAWYDYFGTPEFGYLSGRIAQALLPQGTIGHAVGGLGAEMSTSKGYSAYKEGLMNGMTPQQLDQAGFGFLPAEMKMKAAQAVMEERRSASQEQYYGALTGQAKATTAGTAPYQERFNHEIMKALIQTGNKDDMWQGWGHGQMRNRRTGEIAQVPVAPRGGPGTADVSFHRWYNQAHKEAARNPEVTQFAKANMVVGPDGVPILQWTDATKGTQAYSTSMYQNLLKFEAVGKITHDQVIELMRPLTKKTSDGRLYITAPDGKDYEVK